MTCGWWTRPRSNAVARVKPRSAQIWPAGPNGLPRKFRTCSSVSILRRYEPNLLVDVVVVGFLRGPVTERGVKPSPIVAEFYVLHNVASRVFEGRILGPVHPLDFQRGIE